MNKFKLGDKVKWSSQAGGSWSHKVGTVVAVVPSGWLPGREEWPSLHTGPGIGGSRDHESYIVSVPAPSKVRGTGPKRRPAKPKIYWPRVSKLEAVS